MRVGSGGEREEHVVESGGPAIEVGGVDAGAVEGAHDLHERDALAEGDADGQDVAVERRWARREFGRGLRDRLEIGGRRHRDVDQVLPDSCLQLLRCSVGDHEAVVQHDDVVGQAVGLFEVLSGEHDRGAFAGKVAQDLPQLAATERIETGGGLVEEQHLGGRDDARGEVETATHAAAVGLHQPVGVFGQVQLLEQFAGSTLGDGLGQIVEAADHDEVGAGREQTVDRRLLGGDADAPAHLERVGDDVVAGDAGRALGREAEGGEDLDGRGLAGAVVAEQAEHRARGDVEVEVAEGPHVAVALAETLGVEPDVIGAHTGAADEGRDGGAHGVVSGRHCGTSLQGCGVGGFRIVYH